MSITLGFLRPGLEQQAPPGADATVDITAESYPGQYAVDCPSDPSEETSASIGRTRSAHVRERPSPLRSLSPTPPALLRACSSYRRSAIVPDRRGRRGLRYSCPLPWSSGWESSRRWGSTGFTAFRFGTTPERSFSPRRLGSPMVVALLPGSDSGLRRALVLTTLCTLGFELASRGLWKRALQRSRNEGPLALRTLIFGTNDEADGLARSLLVGRSGFKPLGYVAGFDRIGTANGLHVLGSVDALTVVVRRHEADCIFVASTDVSASEMAVVASSRPAGATGGQGHHQPPQHSSLPSTRRQWRRRHRGRP